jgi:hypothetical protein
VNLATMQPIDASLLAPVVSFCAIDRKGNPDTRRFRSGNPAAHAGTGLYWTKRNGILE